MLRLATALPCTGKFVGGKAASLALIALLVLVLPLAALGSVTGSLVDPDGNTLATLTAGSRFTLRVEGAAVSVDDHVRIVDGAKTCRAGFNETMPVVRWPFGGVPEVNYTEGELGVADDANASQSLLAWNDLAVLEAGSYQLCYCAAVAAAGSCDKAEEFDVQVFSFSVLGPTVNQAFECDAGWECEVGPVTGDLVVGSRLRVMTKCYPPERTDGFIPGSGAQINETDLTGDPTISLDAVGIERIFSWGSERILGPATHYELCWCSGESSGCNQTEDFLARAGVLAVPGPSKAMEVLCSASGHACHFAVEQGISLADGDRVMVLGECSGVANMSSPGFPDDGLTPPSTNDGRDFRLAEELGNSTAMPIGSYRLCWCHRKQECLDSSDFRLEIGTLTIAGPTGGQSWVCTMGQSCTLTSITGVTLAVDDHFIAAEECGVSGYAAGFKDGSVLPDTLSPIPSSNSSMASFQWAQVRASTGTYKVCWASAWQMPSRRSCNDLGWNDTAEAGAGLLSICAETLLDASSCTQVSATSAAAACSTRGARLCLPHEIAQGEALGTQCDGRDRWTWTSQSCALDNEVVSRVDGGEDSSKCQPRMYKVTPWQSAEQLHWGACCADATAAGSSPAEYFADVSNFAATAGVLKIHGPFLSYAYCVMGDPCPVTIDGLGLAGASDRLQIIHRNATCDDAGAVLATSDFEYAKSVGTAVTIYEETFSLGKSFTFAAFWMCWCSVGGGVDCTKRSDFSTTAGELLVGGINEQIAICIFSRPCVLNLNGTNLGATDSVLVAEPDGTCGTAAPLPEASNNPATTTNATDTNTKTFDLGSIMLHGDFRICYCIQFGTRTCFEPGPVLERFSLTGGFVKVYGPFFNATPVAARTGVSYALEISGRQLSLLNRITVQDSVEGSACGEEGSVSNDAAVTLPSLEPTSVATDGSQQVWDGVMVLHAGDYRVCWCRGDDDCTSSSSYSMQVAWLVVNGIWKSVIYETQIAGNPFLLSLNGRQLTFSDRVVFVNRFLVARCGDTGTLRYAELAMNAEGAPFLEDQGGLGGAETWRNVVLMNVGEYLVCWCGHAACDLDVKFAVEAAQLTVTGPFVTDFEDAIAGEYFQIAFSGVALTESDRISLVDSTVECGHSSADDLASTVVVSNATVKGSRVSAEVLGPPAYSNESQQVWSGLMIRWQGTYKVCWGGKHDISGPCLGASPTNATNCNISGTAHHPFHVGNLRVTYGTASVIGQARAARCDALDLNAFSPTAPLDNYSALDAFAAEWACTPCGEFCGSLQPYLQQLGSGSLHLHIPADVIANSLDRARWVATGFGEEFSEEHFTLSVTMTDTHNVTRWGSLPIVISSLQPFVYAWPPVVQITLSEELHLEVHTNIPGGIVCASGLKSGVLRQSVARNDAGTEIARFPQEVNVSWSIAPSINSKSLHLTSAAVASLDVGVHNISARVEFEGAFAPQEVFFLVKVISPPVPSVILRGPERASSACPVAVDASTSVDFLYAEATLSYRLYSSCTGLQRSSCSGSLPSNSAPVQLLPGGSLQLGQNTLGVSVDTADGRTFFSNISIEVGSGGAWPFTPAPLPQTVPSGSQVDCAVTTAAADTGSCAAPAGTAWMIHDLQGNASSLLATEKISIASGTNSGLRLQATVPASMLRVGGEYRCILREGDTDVYTSDIFTVGSPPSGGRVIVAPKSGVALQTRFTSSSVGWASENGPLEHMFVALPKDIALMSVSDPIDASRFLRGWASEGSAGFVLGITGPLHMVARVRDSLGSEAQAVTEFEVASVSDSAILAGDIYDAAQWPPTARSLLTADAAFVNAALSTAVNSSSLVTSLLDTLLASLQLSSTSSGPEDLALYAWALEQTLLLASSELSVDDCVTAARILESSAAQGAAQAIAATRKPIDVSTTERFLRAASVVSEAGAGVNSQDVSQQVTETFRALRAFEQDLGLALRAGLRRSSWLHDVTAAEWEQVRAAGTSVLTGRVLRSSIVSGISLHAYGLQLRVPSVASSRRLSTTPSEGSILAGSCHPQHAEVQLMHWKRNPMDGIPWDQQVHFEGILSDMVATWPSGYGWSHPYVASCRLWICPEGLQRVPGVSIRFDIDGGIKQTGSVQEVRNGSVLLTYHLNISWVCAQWDSATGLWRAATNMLVNISASAIQCVSQLDARENDVVYLAAFPGARTTLQSERPVDSVETKEAGVEFDATPLVFLLIAAIAVQIPLVCLCVLDFRDRPKDASHVALLDPPGCMFMPAVPFSDGLWHLRPRRCCMWPCMRRSRSQSDIVPVDADDTRFLQMPIVADAQTALETEPALREDACHAAKAAHDIVQTLSQEKQSRASARFESAGCTATDYQQVYWRSMLMASIAAYRRLLLASDRIRQSLTSSEADAPGPDAGVQCGIDVCHRSGVSRQDETFVLRVAHHVQSWMQHIDDAGDDLKLNVDEELSLKCTHKALGEAFVRARGGAPALPMGGAPDHVLPPQPQPFFAPITSVRLVLLSVEIATGKSASTKSKTAATSGTTSRSTSNSGSGSGTSKKDDKSQKTATGNFSGVMPQVQDKPTSAWDDGDATLESSGLISQPAVPTQPYLPGCSYFMWAHQRMLYVHRAETLLQYRQLPPQPLDEALSRHESTRCYNLESDVEDVTVGGTDDRQVVLSLRRGPVLRWRIDGEVRPWVESLQRPFLLSVDTMIDNVDLVHGVCREPTTFFFYNLQDLPRSASNVYLENVMGHTVPCIMWSSHGGACLSLAFWPHSEKLVDALDAGPEDAGMPPPGMLPLDDAAPGQQRMLGREGSTRRVLAFYVSDIESLSQELRENTVDSSPHRFCLEIRQVDGVRLRLCFNSRFMRMTCQANLLRLRMLLLPGSKHILLAHKPRPIPIAVRNSSLGFDQPPAGLDHAAQSLPPPGNAMLMPHARMPPPAKPPSAPPTPNSERERLVRAQKRPAAGEWSGFYGYLELKVLSACGLGLTAPGGVEGAQGSVAILSKGFKGKYVAKAALPVPKLFAYLPTLPPPRVIECRKTPDLPERTANPVWQCTWHFTVEFPAEEEPPSDIRLEVWNVDGRNEFLGEVVIPFPLEPGLQQYHCALEANPGKMTERWQVPSGSISFQTKLKSERIPRMPAMQVVAPHLMQALCGTFGVEIIEGVGLRSADFLTSDPYCVVLVNTAPRQMSSWRSSTVYGTLNPVWRELHEFKLNWPNSELSTATEVKIEVWDHDAISNDEFLGEISFALPTGNGENLVDLEVQENRLKGANSVRGRIRARVYFRDQFTEATLDSDEGRLEAYQECFTEYFGSRNVDEQLARAMAAPLIYFHLSTRKLWNCQLWDAWRRATHEVVSKSGRSGKGRAQCYLELTSALWFALAVAACLRAALPNYIGAAAGGVLGGVVAPDLAHILHELIWQRPLLRMPAEEYKMPFRGSNPVFAVLAMLISLLIMAACLGFATEDEVGIQTLVSAAVVLVIRLLVIPLWQACYYAMLLNFSKRSNLFDGQLRRNPSIITASGFLLKGLPLHHLVPTAS